MRASRLLPSIVALVLAAQQTAAQEVGGQGVAGRGTAGARWGLGATVGTARGGGPHAGAILRRDLAGTGLASVRAVVALNLRAGDPTPIICVGFQESCDHRSVVRSLYLGTEAELGPRNARGQRTIYLIGGAGVAATSWGRGVFVRDPGLPTERTEDPHGTTRGYLTATSGLGGEFGIGGDRYRAELRLHWQRDPLGPSGSLLFAFSRSW